MTQRRCAPQSAVHQPRPPALISPAASTASYSTAVVPVEQRAIVPSSSQPASSAFQPDALASDRRRSRSTGRQQAAEPPPHPPPVHPISRVTISRVTMTYNVFNLTNAQVRRYISSRDVLSTLAYHLAQKSLTAASLYRLDFFSSNPRFSNTIEPNTINLRRQEKWLACRIGRVDELKMPALTVELCGVTS